MMKGDGLICLKIDQHGFHEHASYVGARAEANRLAETLRSAIVVYVPVLMVAPPKRTIETPIEVEPNLLRSMREGRVTDETDDLPF
jgi:hypothetical protein